MSKLEKLTQRLCDLVGNQVARRGEMTRLMDEVQQNAEAIGQTMAAIAEEQGRLMLEELRQRTREAFGPLAGEQPDLRMASGTPICVECRKGRLLDENGRCSECAGMVAGASA